MKVQDVQLGVLGRRWGPQEEVVSFCCKRAVGSVQPPSTRFQGLSDVSNHCQMPDSGSQCDAVVGRLY